MSIKLILGGLFGAYAIGAFYVEMFKVIKGTEATDTG